MEEIVQELKILNQNFANLQSSVEKGEEERQKMSRDIQNINRRIDEMEEPLKDRRVNDGFENESLSRPNTECGEGIHLPTLRNAGDTS